MTPGPWALRGRQIRAEDGLGKHVADYMVDAEDGHLLAAAPELEDSLRSIVDAIFHLPDVLREKVMDRLAEPLDDAHAVLVELEKKRHRERALR